MPAAAGERQRGKEWSGCATDTEKDGEKRERESTLAEAGEAELLSEAVQDDVAVVGVVDAQQVQRLDVLSQQQLAVDLVLAEARDVRLHPCSVHR
jgi:hypothetical protein